MERKYEGRPELVKPLVVSLLFPLIGGVYEFLKHRDSEPQLSQIFLYGAFSFPAWIIIPELLKIFNFSNFWSSMTLVILTVLLIKESFLKDNKYADILWIHYMFLPGVIYSYFYKYKDDHEMKYLVYHSSAQAVFYALITGSLIGAALILSSLGTPGLVPA